MEDWRSDWRAIEAKFRAKVRKPERLHLRQLSREDLMAAVTVPPGPLAIDLVMGRERSCREPLLVGEQLLWAEQRPDEGGRTTLML